MGSVCGQSALEYPYKSPSTRWLVPKMVKNGLKSSFAFLGLIWACLMGKSWFQQILKEVEFSNKPLRLHLARLEHQGTQESQKQMHTPKLSQNQEREIKTILHRFRDKPARFDGALIW